MNINEYSTNRYLPTRNEGNGNYIPSVMSGNRLDSSLYGSRSKPGMTIFFFQTLGQFAVVW